MYLLFMILCVLLIYLAACAVGYPLQYLLYHGAMLLKDHGILPEDLNYTMDMAMEHAEMVMGAAIIAFIGLGVIKFLYIVFENYRPATRKAIREANENRRRFKKIKKENSDGNAENKE